jgi:hypothetical protein
MLFNTILLFNWTKLIFMIFLLVKVNHSGKIQRILQLLYSYILHDFECSYQSCACILVLVSLSIESVTYLSEDGVKLNHGTG